MADLSTAYFDESRVDQSHKFPVVAGFFNTTEWWEVFERKWKAVDIPDDKIKKYFRHRPSNHHSQQDEQRYKDSLILAEVMRDYAFWPLYATIDRELFQPVFDIISEHKRGAPLISDAYTMCAFACCELLDDMAERGDVRKAWTPVKVVFHKGNESQSWLERGYNAYYASKDNTHLRETCIFERDVDLIPLRAADAYAWLLARYYNQNEELEALKVLHEPGRGIKMGLELTGGQAKQILERIYKSFRMEQRG